MSHKSISDYNPFPKDCNELSLINDTESNATLLCYPLPTSTIISLGNDVIGCQHSSFPISKARKSTSRGPVCDVSP